MRFSFLGDMAISLGAYSEEILIMVAACNIGNLLTPSYELSMANKVFRIMSTMITPVLGSPGFCISVVIHISILLSTKTIKYPYLYPFIPFLIKNVNDCYLVRRFIYPNIKITIEAVHAAFLLWWNNHAIIWIKNLKKEHERDKGKY